MTRLSVYGLLLLWLTACTGVPKGAVPVQDFELAPYLGTWYEIARLDHRFERGLSDVSAVYSASGPGQISVLNRGYDAAAGEWREARGRARFVGDPTVGHLKVSFFGPFYGAYVILALDPDYQHALVSGPSRQYLWLLSRSQQMPAEVYEDYVARARSLGFPVEQLIRVPHQLLVQKEAP